MQERPKELVHKIEFQMYVNFGILMDKIKKLSSDSPYKMLEARTKTIPVNRVFQRMN